MFRPSIHSTAASKSAGGTGGGNGTKTSPNKQVSSNNDSISAPSTIREIRSRTVGGSVAAGSARQLLAHRRQAMSMERLNGSASPKASSSASMNNISNLGDSQINNNHRNEKLSSPMNGSSNSISGSTASSPSRGSSSGGGSGGGGSTNGGLNRTASRVSRFRSAKAVFERLSSANSQTSSTKPETRVALGGGSSLKGTVASRYAAAAAARGVIGQQNLSQNNSLHQSANTSPRSRVSSNQRVPASGQKSPTVSGNSPKHEQPKPQPRVITTATRRTPIITASHNSNSRSQATVTTSTTITTTSDQPSVKGAAPRVTPAKLSNTSATAATPAISNNQAPGKPPPKDLIDKIVSEIVRDANKEHDADCTIQDLSNCDISGIPETLDFDKCFQDVEMMTEEEARKLLSRKSESPSLSTDKQFDNSDAQAILAPSDSHVKAESQKLADEFVTVKQHECSDNNQADEAQIVEQSGPLGGCLESQQSISKQPCGKSKVRFSDEPATVYDTHAASDYDRRNDDIDPVAASAEYEIEKSRERDGLTCEDDDDGDGQEEGVKRVQSEMMMMLTGRTAGVEAVIQRFNNQSTGSSFRTFEDFRAGSHTQPTGALACHQLATAGDDPHGDSRDSSDNNNGRQSGNNDDEDSTNSRTDYIEALEREVSLKRILEQNLRDLQSQYYETVKQLDSFRGDSETKIAKLEDELVDGRNQLEATQSELVDAREQSNQFEKQLNDIKESSQLLEKKYHRAKRIIKDMTTREESFVRREQLYQQKLDEIEYELSVLISTIDRTIYEDGLKYFSLLGTENGSNNNNNGNLCSKQHQTRLDVLGLIKRMMDRFNESKKSQSEQIKQRIATMLEQQLASLLAGSNGCTSVTAGPVVPISPVAISNPSSNIKPLNSMPTTNIMNNNNNNNNDDDHDNKHNQNYSYASHRLSQPNMPHPIGVGGQPTTIFHGLTSAAPMMPLVTPLNEPSPPQSVNSYPSTNSLNSLNNANSHQQTGNSKLHDAHQTTHETPSDNAGGQQQPTSLLPDELFRASTTTTTPPDVVQVPYQTNEWHDKPVSEWTTTQVSTWLLALGLDQYISKFEDRNVNGQSLINLDSTVLKGLGVLNSTDRNLLKKKIRELRNEMEKERKLMEKKMKENLKEKSKAHTGNGSGTAPSQTNRHSWKKGLLS